MLYSHKGSQNRVHFNPCVLLPFPAADDIMASVEPRKKSFSFFVISKITHFCDLNLMSKFFMAVATYYLLLHEKTRKGLGILFKLILIIQENFKLTWKLSHSS